MNKGTLIQVNGLTYKVTKIENDTVWGSFVVDLEKKTCRRGRPSKFSINDVTII